MTSFLPLYCFAAHVAGDLAIVENLLPAGASPHEYPFTPKDLRRASTADVILELGLGLDVWMDQIPARSSGDAEVKRFVVCENWEDLLPTSTLPARDPEALPPSPAGHRHQPTTWNPHVWLDPVMAMRLVQRITGILSEVDPAHTADYQENARAYLNQLEALHKAFERRLAPCRQTPFACLHDAFPYLVRRYGLDQIGILKPSPNLEPSASYLTELMAELRRRGAGVLFTEHQANSRLAENLAEDLGIPTAELNTLESGPLDPEAYETGMWHNLEILEQHLR